MIAPEALRGASPFVLSNKFGVAGLAIDSGATDGISGMELNIPVDYVVGV
jgi:hypothetical protein